MDSDQNEVRTYQTSAEDFCAIEDTIDGVSRAAEQLEEVEVELHAQLRCLDSVLQLLVLPRLSVHRSIGCLKDGQNVELGLVRLSHKEQKRHESSGVLVCGREVFQPLELGGLVRGVFLHVVGCKHCHSRQLSGLELGLLVPAYP